MPNSFWRRLAPQIFVLLMNARVNVFTLSWVQPTDVDDVDVDDDDDEEQAINFSGGSTLKGDAGKSINVRRSLVAA